MNSPEHYLRPRPRLPASLWLLPLGLLAASLALGMHGIAASSSLASLQAHHDALASAQSIKPVPPARPADVELQKRWKELLAERDFPWQGVFAAVERADRTSIELLEFQPDKRTGRIVLRGEARDLDALTGYLEALSGDPSLDTVHLVHRQLIARNALQTVGFEIKARLRN